jgi:DNA-binding transcriptional MerR regulator
MDYLTLSQLGNVLGVPYHTLRYHIKLGTLAPDVETGRKNRVFLFNLDRVQEIAAIPEIATAKRKLERETERMVSQCGLE